ncbi:ran-binding protein 3-like isoform X2 [Mixophyes fleayi]|uniref:ran-binding protein 3-like isoform X2 n=1 Tax=Mixophyes fleayi TaxID=3061075 RepID=UPI003F4E1CA0
MDQMMESIQSDKALIAQPVFVLEKKERPFKRQAGDLVLKGEHGFCVYPEKRFRSSSFTCRPTHSSTETGNGALDKRVRSSSFSFLTTFPPSQPALKNNVFMSPTLLQERPNPSSADCGCLHSWTVMKPATLQPPQVTECKDVENTDTGTRCHLEDETYTEKSNPSENNAAQSKSSYESAFILGRENRMQPFEQMFTPQKYKADFVFGENMEKRVTIPKRPTPSQTNAHQCKRESTSTRVSCNRNWPYQKHRSHKSLIESAEAYTSRPRQKYELDQVEIITGEESERNVLQVNCKLFVFNTDNQTYTERGRGYLRLNDTASDGNGPFRSRLVMRNHGNLKLIFNSQIFDEMKLERANRKCVRIAATDLADGHIKIFLLQTSVKDAGRLYAAIHHRLVAWRNYRAQKREQSIPNTEDEAPSHLQLLDSDSEDEEGDETTLYPSKISDHRQWIRRQPVLYS